MAVRLSPTGSFLMTYDEPAKKWVTIPALEFSILTEPVDVEPGTTLKHLFDLVRKQPKLKEFLSETCWCDIDACYSAANETPFPLPVPIVRLKADRKYEVTGTAAAKFIVVAADAYLDNEEDDVVVQTFFLDYALYYSASWDLSTAVGFPAFSQRLCDLFPLELRLRREFVIDGSECQEAVLRDYTLLDILLTVFTTFGTQGFDPRRQKQIDEDESLFEALRDLPPEERSGEFPPDDDMD